VRPRVKRCARNRRSDRCPLAARARIVDAADCVRIVATAQERGCFLQIGHVLRSTSFCARGHEIVASGRRGRVSSIDMQENVAVWP